MGGSDLQAAGELQVAGWATPPVQTVDPALGPKQVGLSPGSVTSQPHDSRGDP